MGLAGIGKSTIATTIAKWAREEKGILGGSFFFARDVKELSDPALVFSTLAFQLAQFDPHYKRALYDVLQEDKLVTSAILETQFSGLILRPLSRCHVQRRILIVLDAIDECSREDDVDTILRSLLHSIGSACPNLRILIASRPDAHIRHIFLPPDGEDHHEKFVLHDIDDDLARNDIQTYLKEEFAKFASRDLPKLPKDWPPPEQFNRLLDHCGKFFAYAATAVRFIGDKGIRDPNGQLYEILKIKGRQHAVHGAGPYLELDKLYLGRPSTSGVAIILAKSIPNAFDVSLRPLYVFESRYPLSCLARFLSTTSEKKFAIHCTSFIL